MITSGLAIDFTGKQARLVLDAVVTDFAATVQNALVNLGTLAGSDKIFSDKGTSLLLSGLRGAMANSAAAQHACNFAGVDTQFFSNDHTSVDPSLRLSAVKLVPLPLTSGALQITVQFTSSAGAVVGTTTTI